MKICPHYAHGENEQFVDDVLVTIDCLLTEDEMGKIKKFFKEKEI